MPTLLIAALLALIDWIRGRRAADSDDNSDGDDGAFW